jgi:glycosyltransferase involved in cell wall biosynthesis
MSKKYKLAILTSHPIQYQAPLFRNLAQHPRIDLMVYFCSDFGVTEKVDPGFGKVFKWDIPLLEGYRYKFLKNFAPSSSPSRFWGLINLGIIRELWRGHYDAILIHGYTLATNWMAFITALIRRTPVIFRGETVLRTNQSLLKAFLKKLLLPAIFRRMKAFLPIGKISHNFYRYYGVPQKRLFLTPYSVDNDFFITKGRNYKEERNKIKKEIGIPVENAVILYASKMTPRKRPFDCLKAFEQLNEKASLLFVGDGELRPILETYIYEKRIQNVFFVGFKNQSELPRYYTVADIFVLPSSYEPWGLAINEAMCFWSPYYYDQRCSSRN